MHGQPTTGGRAVRKFVSAVVGFVLVAGVLTTIRPAAAFDHAWFDAGCTVSGTSHGLLDGMSIGAGAEGGLFWMNPVSPANESCAYVSGVNKVMSADGFLTVRVKIDPRVRFQLAAFGTQGDIACAKPLGMLTFSYNDAAFHTMSLPVGKWVRVDCVRMVLDDDPNETPRGREYPYAMVDYVRIASGRTVVWQESFSA